jgi:hypothetical protein
MKRPAALLTFASFQAGTGLGQRGDEGKEIGKRPLGLLCEAP